MKAKKSISIFVTTVLLSASLGISAFAADNATFKDVKAWYRSNMKILVDNQQVALSQQPIIIDGNTYLPVRDVAEKIFGSNVGWDDATSTIYISKRADENAASLTHQLIEKQLLITQLEKKVAELETKVKDLEAQKTTSSSDLKSLQTYLNKEYGTHEKIEFDIYISEAKNKKEITVEIEVDLDDYYSRWNNLSSTSLKKYLQNIADDILDDFKNYDVTGYIEDSSTSKNNELATFYTNSKGTVVVSTKSSGGNSSSYSLSELENYLNKNYKNYYTGITFYIDLTDDRGDVRVDIDVDEDDWDWLKLSERETFLEKLYDEITYEYSNADVYGYVYDGSYKLDSFDFNSSGYVNIW